MQAENSKIDKVWRIIDLIDWGEKYLKEKSIENPIAKLILENKILPDDEIELTSENNDLLINGKPIAP